jgi:hypothetical protein
MPANLPRKGESGHIAGTPPGQGRPVDPDKPTEPTPPVEPGKDRERDAPDEELEDHRPGRPRQHASCRD